MKKFLNWIAGSKHRFSLRHRILNITEFFGILIFLQGGISNYFIKINVLEIIIPFITAGIILILYYYSRILHYYHVPVIFSLGLISFIAGPILWMHDGGLYGPVPYWYVYLAVVISILAEKKKKAFLLGALFVLIAFLAFGQFYDIIYMYEHTDKTRLFYDLFPQVIFVIFTLAMLVSVIIDNYRYEQKKALRYAIHLRRINEKIKQIYATDFLTKIANRAYVFDKLEYEKTKVSRSKKEFGIIIADIDDLKYVNEKYGHDFGDFILREIAKDMKGVLREQDTIARIGGEEFLILLPNTPLDASIHVAEKIRERIYKKLYSQNDISYNITVSFGVTVYNDFSGKRNVDAYIKKADDALFMSKKMGKNRVKAMTIHGVKKN